MPRDNGSLQVQQKLQIEDCIRLKEVSALFVPLLLNVLCILSHPLKAGKVR